MTDSFAPVEPGTPAESQVPAAPLVRTVSTPPPPVIAPAKKGDRTFRVLLAVGLLVAVGGVTFAAGAVARPTANVTPPTATRSPTARRTRNVRSPFLAGAMTGGGGVDTVRTSGAAGTWDSVGVPGSTGAKESVMRRSFHSWRKVIRNGGRRRDRAGRPGSPARLRTRSPP